MPQVKLAVQQPAGLVWSAVTLNQPIRVKGVYNGPSPFIHLPPFTAICIEQISVSQSRGLKQAHWSRGESKPSTVCYSHVVGSPVLLQEAPQYTSMTMLRPHAEKCTETSILPRLQHQVQLGWAEEEAACSCPYSPQPTCTQVYNSVIFSSDIKANPFKT